MSDESLAEPDHERGDDHQRAVVGGALLEQGGDAAPLLEPVDAPLHDVAAAVGLAVEGGLAARRARPPRPLVVALRDDVRDAPPPQRLPAPFVAVPLVGDQAVGPLAGPPPAAPALPTAGVPVLVVDADMRKGHVHSAFNADSQGGLSELLAGKRELDEVIRQSPIDGMSYVARGKAPPNPAELLMSDRFSRLLDVLGERYDLVIIDTPPVLAVTDAAVVGRQSGTTLLVARFGLNPPREIDVAVQRLESSGVEVKGVILNAIERKAATSYGYGYYHYAYKSTNG